MEFPFYVSKVLPVDSENFAILDAASYSRTGQFNSTSYIRTQPYGKSDSSVSLGQIIDKMGEASCQAQGLRSVITTYSKFITSGDNKLYIKVQDNKVCGILKVGKRNLFYHDGINKVRELRPLCVLDFYVHESMQRHGVGKMLFEKMLQTENVEPRKLAYDKPSPKLISFLKKHYDLSRFVPQNNNFIVFNQYWEEPTKHSNMMKLVDANVPPTDINTNRRNTLGREAQTDFHKVGKSILQNNNITYLRKDMNTNMVGYSHNTMQKVNDYSLQGDGRNSSQKSLVDVDTTKKPDYVGGVNSSSNRNFLQENKSRQPEDWTANSRDKSRSGTAEVTNQRNNSARPYLIQTNEGYKEYKTTTPWANFENTTDPYKTSFAYGSYYNQNFRGVNKK